MGDSHIPEAEERVLSTLNRDGTRRWIRPKPAKGPFQRRRLITAWSLIALFTVIPYLRRNGKPLMLFDVPAREFTLFGTTFLPTDTLFLMLLLVGIFVTIFLLTAIFGRVWCGWACPQTVYMEFVYRPIERLFEGSRAQQMKLDREGGNFRRALKYVAFFFVSVFLAHTFLAYFVGVERLFVWVRQSPFEHPTAFLVMAGTAGLMMLDFAYFREQVCLVMCPYGRLQSVLLDDRSMIVGYDTKRGESRGTMGVRRKTEPAAGAWGDCVDCSACVTTCPTGIDIRNGLQMECIGCTQCIDACDNVMTRLGKPRGLIRYSSQAGLAGKAGRVLRPRVIIYPLILVLVFGLLGISLAKKTTADVTLLRGLGSPFNLLPDGEITNQIRVKIVNRSGEPRSYTFAVEGFEGMELIAPENPVDVAPSDTETTAFFAKLPPTAFVKGRLPITVHVTDGVDYDERFEYTLLGPAGRRGGSP